MSAKSQRKFAILIISDGIERYELPIWSDLYEEKGVLLRENQLLFGILQIGKQDESLHLQARFLDDLTKVDENMIKTTSDLYDRLKGSKYQGKSADAKKKIPKPQSRDLPQQLLIHVDADHFRFSHILALKELFRSHPGKSRIEIHFNGAQI